MHPGASNRMGECSTKVRQRKIPRVQKEERTAIGDEGVMEKHGRGKKKERRSTTSKSNERRVATETNTKPH